MPRIDHDSSLRLLFSDPRTVKDFFVGFVDSEIGQLLDWSTLKPAAARHTNEDLKQSENDMIWEVQILGATGPPVYIMLEFQSRPDWTMALRMFNYVGQFCGKLAKQETVSRRRKLPRVLPIVLYNGEGEWTTAIGMADLVEGGLSGWEEQCPQMGYVLVDVFRSAALDRSQRNLADAIFRLHRAGALEAPGEMRWLKQWLGGEEWASLRRELMEWIIKVLLPWRLPGMSVRDLGDLRDLDRLEAAMTTWSEQWKAEGRVGMLVSMARQRFGEAAASTIATLLGPVTSETVLEEVGSYLLTCENGDALIAKIRQI